MEVDRGSYSADMGDRTYGVFNIVPRTGFERNNQAELVLSAAISTRPTINSISAATPSASPTTPA